MCMQTMYGCLTVCRYVVILVFYDYADNYYEYIDMIHCIRSCK